jgi:hypothetical protein
MRRDCGRCAVNGCKNSIWVDIHHTHARSDGGDHHPDKLLVLCAAHHRQVHAGRLLIEGSASAGFVFKHADGTRYGGEPSPERAVALSEAFAALTALGFGDGESKRALERVRTHVGSAEPEEIVRAALRALRPQTSIQ